MEDTQMPSLFAIIEWAAYYHHDKILQESVEQFTKSNGTLDATTQSILDINIVYMSVQVASYSEGDAEGEDNFDAILKSINELEAKYPTAVPSSRWAEAKRLCVIQKAMRYICLSWFNGEAPATAEDIKLAANHNFYATVEKIKDIFRDNKEVYFKYEESDPLMKEKFNHDIESLSVDVVKAQTAGSKVLKAQKLKLFDRFESHKLADFKQYLSTLIDDVLAQFPRPVLRCFHEGSSGDVVEAVAHEQDWDQSAGPYKKGKKAKKTSSDEAVSSSNEVRKNLYNTVNTFAKKYQAQDPLPEGGKKRGGRPPKKSGDEPEGKRAKLNEDIEDSDSELEDGRSRGIQLLKDTAEKIGFKDGEFPESLRSPQQKKTSLRDPATGRLRWSYEEEEALKQGIEKHGYGNWAKVLEDPLYGYILKDRTNVNLKDKYRNLQKAGVVPKTQKQDKSTAEEGIEDGQA